MGTGLEGNRKAKRSDTLIFAARVASKSGDVRFHSRNQLLPLSRSHAPHFQFPLSRQFQFLLLKKKQTPTFSSPLLVSYTSLIAWQSIRTFTHQYSAEGAVLTTKPRFSLCSVHLGLPLWTSLSAFTVRKTCTSIPLGRLILTSQCEFRAKFAYLFNCVTVLLLQEGTKRGQRRLQEGT